MQDFKSSRTKVNLMRAFTGESQARNRYTFAEAQARQMNYFALADLFKFTASQEKAHAQVFYDHLKSEQGDTIHIEGGYPVDISTKLEDILQYANYNELQEADDVYPAFAAIAREEGFTKIAQDFQNIAKIERTHAERFENVRKLMSENKLYHSDNVEIWVCLNCGYILEGHSAPEKCPVCGVPQGYYVSSDGRVGSVRS